MIKESVCFTSTIAFLLNALAFAHGPMASPDRQQGVEAATSPEEVEARLEQLISIVEQVRAAIDRSQFDLDALLDSLDYEAEEIIRFVQEEIAFEQYPGLLRGAQGTLVSRAGNSLDQSVLLASLLKDAGYEARIVRGVLTEEQGRLLLAEMGRPRKPAPPAFKDGNVRLAVSDEEKGEVAEVNRSLTLLMPDNRAKARRQVAETAELLASVLQEAESRAGDSGFAWREDVRDYFWLEHRSGPADAWLAVHPAQGPSVLFSSPEPLEYFVDEIPPSLQHRIRFQVFIEQKFGTKIVVHQITPEWERPAANLFGKTMSYANYPSGLETEEDLLTLAQSLEETQAYLPLFNGDVAREGRGFDLNGIPFELNSMGMDKVGATALFRQVGSSFESAAAALVGLADAEQAKDLSDLVTLTAQWIDYTLIAPGGRETHFRKYLLDRIGLAKRQESRLSPAGSEDDFKSALFVRHDFLVMPGSICEAFYVDRFSEGLLSDLLVLRGISRVEDPIQKLKSAARQLERMPLNLLTAAYAFDVLYAGEAQAAAYRSEPGLITYELGLTGAHEALAITESVDIIHSRRRSVGDHRKMNVAVLMRVGIWETLMEGAAIAADEVSRFDAFTAFEGLSGDDLAVITPDDATGLQVLGFAAEDEYHVRRDLEQGYLIVAPRRSATAVPSAWWRIDPNTGETIGRISGGRGGALTENIIFQASAALLLAVVAIPATFCAFNKGKYQDDFGCCFAGEGLKMMRGPAMLIGWTSAVVALNRQIGDMQRCGRPADPGPPPPTRQPSL